MPVARQIAEALEYAHDKGIIHRDLKPANVKITPDGNVKVLDFGLAKALQSDAAPVDAAESPTITFAATQAGVILGTAAYMSPEQARGKPADRRSDIWAFGCVLYEMLAGRRAFEGETVSDTLAAVLRADVDWRPLPTATPPSIHQLLRRCLDRDPKRRLQSVGELRNRRRLHALLDTRRKAGDIFLRKKRACEPVLEAHRRQCAGGALAGQPL